jgi:phenylacetate-coenzyme A ligase PaaK-like adenylate-forming protein
MQITTLSPDCVRLTKWWVDLLDSTSPDSLTETLQSEALQVTVEYARSHVPYYEEAFKRAGQVTRLENLRQLPLLDPAILTRYRHPVLARGVPTDFVVFSGGTTPGGRKYLHRSFQEYPPLDAYRDRFPPATFSYSYDRRPAEARVVLFDGMHGVRYIENRRGPLGIVYVPLIEIGHVEIVRDLLAEAADGEFAPELTELWGTWAKVWILTDLAAAESWAQPNPFRRIFFGGYFMPGAVRERVEATWGAKTVVTFGQTEFHQSYAPECPVCGWHHLEPIVVSEVVDVDDPSQPVEQGFGRLVLTHLVPTSLRQPLIRYDSGDVVEVGGFCEAADAPKYRLIGRLSQTAIVEAAGGRRAIGPTSFIEAGIASRVRLHGADPLAFHPRLQHIGMPAMNVQATAGTPARVEVALEADSLVAPEHYDAVRAEFIDGLRMQPDLAELLADGEIDLVVHVHSPGTIVETFAGLPNGRPQAT